MSHLILQLNTKSFHATLKQGVVLVDLWGPWCGPCRMQTPILQEVASRVADRATIAKVNVDETPELAGRFGIRSIPTLLLFKDGKQVRQFVGVQSRSTLISAIKDAAKSPTTKPCTKPDHRAEVDSRHKQ